MNMRWFGLCLAVWFLFDCRGTGEQSADDTSGDTVSSGGEGELSIDDSLFTEPTETVAKWITPEWYTCETQESACGLPCEPNDLWVAINETDFRDSRVCGACMTVTAGESTVTVEVIENCGSACADGEIELSRTAFEQLGNLDEGHVEVAWQLVPCPREGPIQISYESDSDEWWAGIQIRNAVLPVESLEIRYDDNDWERLEMDGWNHFPVSGDLASGPFDFRITAINGGQIEETDIPYRPGETVQGTAQFVL